ncbi:MAG: hypothetical protein ACWGNP_02100 [Candidatus Bathyarchaeia archaeon]
MASTKYTKSISSDFPNEAVDTARLTQEIQASSIVTALDYINTSGDDCDIWFKDALSAGDQTTLGTVVGAHSGEALADSMAVTISDLAKRTKDNKLIALVNPSTEGWATWFCGAGDHATNGRGEGTALKSTFTGAAEQNVEVTFNEPVELHDGQVFWSPVANWDNDDRYSFAAVLPATPTTSTPGTGNCDKVASGQGYNIIVPAAGDGDYTVDLDDAVPVPSDDSTGYWACNYDTGVVSVGSPGAAEFHLIDAAVTNYFLKHMPMGNPLGVFDIDTYKAEWIHQNWKLKLSIDKNSSSAGEVGGWLMLFRKYVQ